MGECLQHDRYPELVGSLQHLANCTRPDLAQAVSTLARYSKAPREAHWHAALNVLRYVSGTLSRGITYCRDAPAYDAFCDANYGGDVDSRRSTTGYVFMMSGGAVSWQSKLQATVAVSTCEAEYQAAGAAIREAVWLRKLLPELGVDVSGPLTLKGDNQAAIALLHNPMSTTRSKHIDIVHHFGRERVLRGEVAFEYCASKDNVADCLTKPLPATGWLPLLGWYGDALKCPVIAQLSPSHCCVHDEGCLVHQQLHAVFLSVLVPNSL